MVESLRELNEICQKRHYKTHGNWMVRKILRPAALPCTWLLLHTPISANQVTLASLLIGVLGCAFLVCPQSPSFLAAMLLLQLWYYLDHVDGQIARYRKTVSLSGRFFDFLMHHLIHGIFLFAAGCYVYFRQDHALFLFWAYLVSISIISFNMIHDIKYKTFFEALAASNQAFTIASGPAAAPVPEADRTAAASSVFSWVHKACEMHVMMNTFTLAALLQTFLIKGIDFRTLLFFLYGVLVPAVSLMKITYWINTKKIDTEYEKYTQNG